MNGNEWSREDVAMLAGRPPGMSLAELAEKVGRTTAAVQSKLKKLRAIARGNVEGCERRMPANPVPRQDSGLASEHRFIQTVRLPVFEAANFGMGRIAA